LSSPELIPQSQIIPGSPGCEAGPPSDDEDYDPYQEDYDEIRQEGLWGKPTELNTATNANSNVTMIVNDENDFQNENEISQTTTTTKEDNSNYGEANRILDEILLMQQSPKAQPPSSNVQFDITSSPSTTSSTSSSDSEIEFDRAPNKEEDSDLPPPSYHDVVSSKEKSDSLDTEIDNLILQVENRIKTEKVVEEQLKQQIETTKIEQPKVEEKPKIEEKPKEESPRILQIIQIVDSEEEKPVKQLLLDEEGNPISSEEELLSPTSRSKKEKKKKKTKKTKIIFRRRGTKSR